mmetsp:Transcript_22947/g.50725  ORF Transcript_22947/g.50725 Transcript_22947/m.50725 type:complete len:190 (-) Transcript_22947:256-825(-)
MPAPGTYSGLQRRPAALTGSASATGPDASAGPKRLTPEAPRAPTTPWGFSRRTSPAVRPPRKHADQVRPASAQTLERSFPASGNLDHPSARPAVRQRSSRHCGLGVPSVQGRGHSQSQGQGQGQDQGQDQGQAQNVDQDQNQGQDQDQDHGLAQGQDQGQNQTQSQAQGQTLDHNCHMDPGPGPGQGPG